MMMASHMKCQSIGFLLLMALYISSAPHGPFFLDAMSTSRGTQWRTSMMMNNSNHITCVSSALPLPRTSNSTRTIVTNSRRSFLFQLLRGSAATAASSAFLPYQSLAAETSTSTGMTSSQPFVMTGIQEPWNAIESTVTKLGTSRIRAQELSPLTPSFIPFSVDNELYYGASKIAR